MSVSSYLKADGSLLEKSAVTTDIAYNSKELPLW
jgi:hypothetical protein